MLRLSFVLAVIMVSVTAQVNVAMKPGPSHLNGQPKNINQVDRGASITPHVNNVFDNAKNKK
jgi:hypothetical protein